MAARYLIHVSFKVSLGSMISYYTSEIWYMSYIDVIAGTICRVSIVRAASMIVLLDKDTKKCRLL